jgi:hypothetical protein
MILAYFGKLAVLVKLEREEKENRDLFAFINSSLHLQAHSEAH